MSGLLFLWIRNSKVMLAAGRNTRTNSIGLFNTRICWLVCLLSAVLAGCAGEKHIPVAKVAGAVTYEGKPVSGGMLNFSDPKSGQQSQLTIDAVGHYSGEIVAGQYQVSVVPASSFVGGMEADGSPKVAPPVTQSFPEKYGDPTTSGFTLTVSEGDAADTNFEMKK